MGLNVNKLLEVNIQLSIVNGLSQTSSKNYVLLDACFVNKIIFEVLFIFLVLDVNHVII